VWATFFRSSTATALDIIKSYQHSKYSKQKIAYSAEVSYLEFNGSKKNINGQKCLLQAPFVTLPFDSG
jgi:hypothetical protein